MHLSELVKKRYYFILFWAEKCPQCDREMYDCLENAQAWRSSSKPNLGRLYKNVYEIVQIHTNWATKSTNYLYFAPKIANPFIQSKLYYILSALAFLGNQTRDLGAVAPLFKLEEQA